MFANTVMYQKKVHYTLACPLWIFSQNSLSNASTFLNGFKDEWLKLYERWGMIKNNKRILENVYFIKTQGQLYYNWYNCIKCENL